MGDERRINQLTAKAYSNIGSSDYFAVDNASEAESKKLAASSIKTPISNLEGEVTGGSDTYSPNKNYSVGEYATHTTSGVQKLYRCKTACTAASWTTNASCFEEANLADAVSRLNNEINAITEIPLSFNTTNFTNSNTHAFKYMNMVFMFIYGTQNVTTDVAELFSFPAAYAPKGNVCLLTQGGTKVEIFTNGHQLVLRNSGAVGAPVRGTIIYLLNTPQ